MVVMVWYVLTVVLWASKPLADGIPVGVDSTLKAPGISLDIVGAVSIDVKCNSLFATHARGNDPLPVLKAQPRGAAPLAYSHEPCTQVHREARTLLVLDTALVVVLLSVGGWLVFSRFRAPPIATLSKA
jgi:hypothetical protein